MKRKKDTGKSSCQICRFGTIHSNCTQCQVYRCLCPHWLPPDKKGNSKRVKWQLSSSGSSSDSSSDNDTSDADTVEKPEKPNSESELSLSESEESEEEEDDFNPFGNGSDSDDGEFWG